MQFTNLTFILVFLPITLIVYYFVKLEHRPIVAIAFSILFYSWGTPEYIGLLFVSVSINIIVSAILTSLNKKKNISILFKACVIKMIYQVYLNYLY